MNEQTSTWTFAMIDLAGFTALTESHGDEHAADLAVSFADMATRHLGPKDRLVKTIGDAVLLAAQDVPAGLKLVRSIFDSCYEIDGYPVARAGIHHGSAVIRGGDMFGAAINLTARVAAQAGGGKVLATTEVAEEARRQGLPVKALGAVDLRNVSESVELFELSLFDAPDEGVVDPVCRMHLTKSRATGTLQHHEVDFWFCSLQCASEFAKNPDRFVQAR
ncbi:MAG: YHS domain-containing protein [Aeromicrobium sp.]